MLFLLKRDAIFKAGLACTLLTPLVVLPGREAGIAVVSAICFLAYLSGICTMRPRTTHFEIGLPIAGRQFLLARVLSMAVVVWSAVGACLALLASQRGFDKGIAIQVLEGATAVTLAALLPQSVRIRDAVIPKRVSILLWLGAMLAACAVFYWLPPMVGLLGFAAADIAVFARAWSTVPKALQIAPSNAGAAQTLAVDAKARRPAWWLLWWSACVWMAPLVFLMGMVTSIVSMFASMGFAGLILMVFISRQCTRWLQLLPVSRRVLLGLTLAVTVIPFIAGAAAGMAIVPSLPSPFFGEVAFSGPQPHRGMHLEYPTTNVPLELWKHAPSGIVPEIQAPWGETARPATFPVLGLSFYNPYASGKANSYRFFEWQFERATEALHGRPYSISEYQQFDFGTVLPHVSDLLRSSLLALDGLLFGSLFSLFLHELALSYSLFRGSSLRSRLPLLAPFAIPFLVDEYYLFWHSTPVTLPLARMFLQQVSALLPQNLWAAGAVGAFPALAMYSLLQWQFAKSEMTSQALPNQLRGV